MTMSQIEEMLQAKLEEIRQDAPDGHLILYFDEHPMTVRQLPPEFFMREFLALDLEAFDNGGDPTEFTEFLIKWGPLILPPRLLEQHDVAHVRPAGRSPLDEPRVLNAELPPHPCEHRVWIYEEVSSL